LFNRMLLISREAVMSSTRIVVSSAGMAGALVIAAWYGSLAFPLTASTAIETPVSIAPPPSDWSAMTSVMRPAPPRTPATGPATAVSPTRAQQPRDPRPDVPRVVTAREQALQGALRKDPTSVPNWLELAKLQEQRGAIAEAATTFQAALTATQSRDVLLAVAGFSNRQGEFDKTMAALEEAAARDASDPAGHQLVAVYYWEKAQKDQRLTPAQKLNYLQAGIAAADRAIANKPDYVEALTYKNIMLRMQANMEADPTQRQALLAEADALRGRAMELARARGPVALRPDAAGNVPPPPPPPPAPYPVLDGQTAYRVGGGIQAPIKIRDVKPVYPPIAQEARVTGVVIVEALITNQGTVDTVRVLRSIPLLDQAAIDAVRQWRFTPTIVDGVAVPVLMTLTVSFQLQ
jgi:TonB family protein